MGCTDDELSCLRVFTRGSKKFFSISVSLFKNKIYFPVDFLAPKLQPPAKPRFFDATITSTKGKSFLMFSTLLSYDWLSTTIISKLLYFMEIIDFRHALIIL